MTRFFRFCPLLLAAVLLLTGEPAFAGKRVALVLANSAYRNAPPLANPVNDGAVIARTLKDAGFDAVDFRRDLAALETRRALRDFSDLARDAEIAVVYYAGHGIEVDGSNYLIPVDARLERDTDVYDETFSLDRVLVAVEPAKQLRLVILDACRDNPFTRTMKRTVTLRSLGRGLAKVEPASPNTLIAYSAKAGMTALDGDGKNSPFTVALSNHLTTPGLDVRRAFGFVRDDVLKSTGNRQEPFVYGSLGGDDVPLVPKAAPAVPPAVNPQADIRRDYELALQVGSKAALDAFLAQHPEGFYASLAKLQLDKITAEKAHAAAAEKAREAEQARARLAVEGARNDAQAKAEAEAKAAEQARVAAEQAQAKAQQQAAEAERQRASLAASPPAADNSAARTPASQPTPDKGMAVAALGTAPTQVDVTKSVQNELRRVGCLAGEADGHWNVASRRSLARFNRYAGTRFDVKVASTDALDAIKLKQSRVCPLVCARGYKADGDGCTRIVCGDGYSLNDDNACERKRSRASTARRDDGTSQPRATREPPRPQTRAGSQSAGGATGQIYCDAYRCRPVQRGCHLEYRGGGGPGATPNAEVCN